MSYTTVNQRRPSRLIWIAPATIGIALLAYSQAVAYFGNESFHLLAAQLINVGKKPYLDFFYQHTPLFIYLNAAWMRIFGETWRSAHVLSALLTGGCVAAVANYVYNRLDDTRWRLAISAATAALLGLNFYVICFGTAALPFGLCLLVTFVAFRLTTAAVRQPGVLLPFSAGMMAGAAAASSLLTAPVCVVLIVWLVRHDLGSDRRRKCISFAVGAVLPFLPLIWLGLLAPRPIFFDLVEYHLFHRAGSEGNMIRWNLREIVDWFGSIQGLVLVSLALIGLSSSAGGHGADDRRREFHLCAWLTVALSLYLVIPRPTFAFYFVLVTPFVSVLAASGLQTILTAGSKRIIWLVPALFVVYSVGLVSQGYKMRREIFQADHKIMEGIARDVNQVTPINGWVFAFEPVYFEARRLPPPGMENAFNPNSRSDEWLAENRFATVCMMANDPRVKSLDLFSRYAQNKAITTPNFTVYLFWERVGAPSEPP